VKALMDGSLEITGTCLEKIDASQGKVEIKMEACLEEIKAETIGTLEDRTRDSVIPARCKGRSRKGSTVEKRRRKGPERNSGIKDRCARPQLRLR
jgi:hypothetical protein